MSYIKINGVGKSFGSKVVLKDINLEVNKGEVLSIIGQSGSGKSTLLRMINLLETVDKGTIEIDGVLNTKRDDLYQRVSMVFQSFNLFENMTVLENCTVTLIKILDLDKQSAQKMAMAKLEIVKMDGFANQSVSTLSGGQKQRVAIARSLAIFPDVILMDEPTSALDPMLVREVLEAIEIVKSTGVTLIIVTHEMSFARSISDSVAFMSEGQIVVHDVPSVVFEHELLKEFV